MTADCFAPACSAVPADSPNHSGGQALTSREKISRERSIADSESSSGTNCLQRQRRKASSARSDRTRKGWTPERRARQAASIRNWAPWRRSTGPKTDAGKARCAMNALKHGFRSQATIREYQRIRYVLRLAARNIELLRLHIRLRDARPRIKYKLVPSANASKLQTASWDIGEHRLPLSPCGSRALLRQRSCRGPERTLLNRFKSPGAGEGDGSKYQETASPNPGRFGPHALGLE